MEVSKKLNPNRPFVAMVSILLCNSKNFNIFCIFCAGYQKNYTWS